MRRLLLKLRRRRTLHADLEAELAFHREQAAAHGNTIPLGSTARIIEESLDMWRFTTLENLWRDLVYAARGLWRSPALLASALVSLGLGVGLNTTIFSLATELLFSRPSVSSPDTLVGVRLGGSSHAPRPVVEMIRDSHVFPAIVGENEESFLNWDDGERTRQVFGVVATKNYFSTLGIPVALGRGFVAGDPDQVVVLGHRFWQSRLGGNPSILGRTLRLEGRPYTVVGVLPAVHRTLVGFGLEPDLYVPVYLPDTLLAISARLAPGDSIEVARERMQALAVRIDAAFPSDAKYAKDVAVEPVGLTVIKGELVTIALFFAGLLGLVSLVLLMACINVAGLLLARASARRRELAVRLSLGATRARIVQQLLVESLLLALLGSGAGLGVAWLAGVLIERISLPLPVPIRLHLQVDWRVTLYAVLLTVVATLATGLLPAWQALREVIASELPRARGLRLRRTLIAGQVAVSTIVLVTSALFVRNLLAASSLSPGFDVRHTLRADVNLPAGAYASSDQIRAFVERTLPALRALPGIEAAAAARTVPFTDSTHFRTTLTFPDSGEQVTVRFDWNAVSAGFFRALDIPVVEGRDVNDADRTGEATVVVNQAFVRQILHGRAPLRTVFLWGRDGHEPHRIVGVVGNTKTMTVGEEDKPQLYQPLARIQNDRRRIQFVLRSATPPAQQVAPVRAVLRQTEASAGAEVETLYGSIGLAFLPSQVGAALTGAAGLLALILAAVGLYGMLAYTVARRLPEIGVRIALGATTRDIWWLIGIDATRLVGIGVAIGLAASLVLTRPLSMFLVTGVSPADPVAFVAVAAMLGLTAVVASMGPVRRAARVDATQVLRAE